MKKSRHENIVSTLVIFSLVDNHFHSKEEDFLFSLCNQYSIETTYINEKIIEFSELLKTNSHFDLMEKAIKNISLQDRLTVLELMNELAAVDDDISENEIKFLEITSKIWGISLSDAPSIKFDTHQNEIIKQDVTNRIIVDAGPGMGKTAIACARVSELMNANISSSEILVLSFTRTAVKEFRDRIDNFLQGEETSLGIKINTIDQRAWSIRYGFSEEKAKNLFGSYDLSIEDAIDKIKSDEETINDEFHSIRHLIIDEAQDITGIRSKLIKTIIGKLSKSCGVTIFCDKAQAIYGFTNDEDKIENEKSESFIDSLEKEFPEFNKFELKNIYRTKSENLLSLFTELRTEILENENVDEKLYQQYNDKIIKYSNNPKNIPEKFDVKNILTDEDTLILFRRRSEVLLASSFACHEGISHRLRLGMMPQISNPWISWLFWDCDDKYLKIEDFKKLFFTKMRKMKKFEVEKYNKLKIKTKNIYKHFWNDIFMHCSDSNKISIKKIRNQLSRIRPPLEFCNPDVGDNGPILGTVHASKGREARNVIFYMPNKITKPKDENYKQLAEESRVMLVGASRPMDNLMVGEGYARSTFSTSLQNGRSFWRKFNKNYVQVEIGREGDLDPISFVSQKIYPNNKIVLKVQKALWDLRGKKPMRVNCAQMKNRQNEWCTAIFLEGIAFPIGCFSKNLFNDLYQIANYYSKSSNIKLKPNLNINMGLYLTGIRSYSFSYDDPHQEFAFEPFNNNGMFLVPVIRGYPNIFLNYSK